MRPNPSIELTCSGRPGHVSSCRLLGATVHLIAPHHRPLENDMTRTAQCFCGAASVSVNGEPRMHAICHCSDCKRRTGSAFAISAYFLRTDVAETMGETTLYSSHRRDDDHVAHFCKTCNSLLFWYTAARPHLIGISGGCFPDGSLAEPTISAKNVHKLPWVGLPDSWKML